MAFLYFILLLLSTAAAQYVETDTPSQTCPPYTIGTYTTTDISFVDVITRGSTTETFTNTIRPSSVAVYNTDSTLTEYAYTSTSVTTFYTFSVYDLVLEPAPTTVSKPTNPGFTPLLCDPKYFEHTTTTTNTVTVTREFTDVIDITLETTSYTTTAFTATVTTTVTPETPFTTWTYATSTTTLTRSDPTQTVYAACETNNVTPDFPGGGYFYESTGLNGTTYEVVPAADAVDCCGLCQGKSSCVASYFLPGLLNYPPCQLFYKDSSLTTCDPTYKGIYTFFAYNQPGVVASNGPCGQIEFGKTQLT